MYLHKIAVHAFGTHNWPMLIWVIDQRVQSDLETVHRKFECPTNLLHKFQLNAPNKLIGHKREFPSGFMARKC